MAVRILRGDVRDRLKTLPDESVHCVVTSPPYWGLRDYGMAGQLGLEDSPDAFVAAMVGVFQEVRRVLREDGTCWLNLGDSYYGSAQSGGASSDRLMGSQNAVQGIRMTKSGDGLKPKDLCGIPWRVAFALQADGWYLRQDIIWHKPNPMPESVRDRCTKAHEYIFLLAKSERYYYDAESVREENQLADTGWAKTKEQARVHGNGQTAQLDAPATTHRMGSIEDGRNKRSVWTVATQPFKEAHFATFPPALIEPCILAGCPLRACVQCGAPEQNIVERTPAEVKSHESDYGHGAGRNDGGRSMLVGALSEIVGRVATCACAVGFVPGTVLDPFGGAGTTGLVADRLQRDAILIELNPEYADMAERRIRGDSPLFAQVGT